MTEVIEVANAGDIIELAAGNYTLSVSLKINKALTIQSADADNKAILQYSGEANTPAFEMNPKGELTLRNIQLKGNSNQ